MATYNLPTQLFTANTWFFSAGATVPAQHKGARISATDPLNQWFTRPGNVKAWGIQKQGYVGGPWDNQAPWLGWGWWLYTPGGDVLANQTNPDAWVAFGSSAKNDGVTVPLFLVVSSGQVIGSAGDVIRLAVMTDAAISLGTQIVTT